MTVWAAAQLLVLLLVTCIAGPEALIKQETRWAPASVLYTHSCTQCAAAAAHLSTPVFCQYYTKHQTFRWYLCGIVVIFKVISPFTANSYTWVLRINLINLIITVVVVTLHVKVIIQVKAIN